MRTPRLADERGMALAVAIFALVVVGALIAGAFFAGNLEQRTGRNTVYASEASDAAESGVSSVFANWDVALNGLAVGDSLSESATSLGARINVTPKVVRLNNELFLVRSLGQRTDPAGRVLAQRTVAVVGRLVTVTTTAKAAVTVTKPVAFNGNAFEVIGNDSTPAGWAGCAAGANQAGIRSATTTGAAGKDTTNLYGVPKQIANDPTVTSSMFNLLGDKSFDELKAAANIVLPNTTPYNGAAPSTTGNPVKCNAGDQLNWGEPHRNGAGYVAQCITYFPIIYGSGTQLKMAAGGRGQGLLLVEGDLEIAGGFEFTGLIIAKGGIKISGNGNKITGALLAQDVALDDQNSISGNTTLQYSSCAISKALAGSASAKPLTQRSWAQVY
jgi:Tfp pilus assembly protein PilX